MPGMSAEDHNFTEEELAAYTVLVKEALADPRPRLTPEEVDRRLDELHERTLRERRRVG